MSTAGPTSKRRTSARSVGTIGCRGWNTRLRAAAAYGCPPARPQPRVRATELPRLLCSQAFVRMHRQTHSVQGYGASLLSCSKACIRMHSHPYTQCASRDNAPSMSMPGRPRSHMALALAGESTPLTTDTFTAACTQTDSTMSLQGQTQTLACVWPTRGSGCKQCSSGTVPGDRDAHLLQEVPSLEHCCDAIPSVGVAGLALPAVDEEAPAAAVKCLGLLFGQVSVQATRSALRQRTSLQTCAP